MNTPVPVPLWVMLVVLALLVAWNVVTAWQTKLLRDLFRMYWRAQYGTDDELPSEARPSNG